MIREVRFAAAPVFLAAILAGAELGLLRAPSSVLWSGWAVLGVVAVLSVPALRLSPARRGTLVMVAAALVGASAGAYGIRRVDMMASRSVARFIGCEVEATGVVVAAHPGAREPEIILKTESVALEGSTHQAVGRVRVRLPSSPDSVELLNRLRSGAVVSLTAALEAAQLPMNPGEPDYRAVLLQDGIHAIAKVSPDSVRVGRERTRDLALRIIGVMRDGLVRAARETLPDRERRVLVGMVFGDSGELDPEILDSFRRAGVSHLLAASGLHLGLVAGLSDEISRAVHLSSSAAAATSLTVALIYSMAAGLRASVVRAWLTLGVCAIARARGRRPGPVQALCVSASLQLLWNPLLAWNAGFQMSYLAAMAASVAAPRLNSIIPSSLPKRVGWLFRSIIGSGAITAATLPVLVNITSRFSMVGVFANLLAVPMAWVGMIAGLVGCVLGALFLPAGAMINSGTAHVIAALIDFAEWASAVPMASVDAGRMGACGIALYYSAFLAVCWLASDEFRRWRACRLVRRRPLCVSAFAFCVLLALTMWPRPLEAIVFSVGQGDSIFLSTPSGHTILVDAGSGYAGGRYIAPYLKRRGIRRLDLLVITHEHADHSGGLQSVCSSVDVLAAAVPQGSSGPEWDRIAETMGASSAGSALRVFRVGDGDSLRLGCVSLEFRNPPKTPNANELGRRGIGDPNEKSVVIRVAAGSFSMLLCADAGKEFEQRVLALGGASSAALRAKVIKVGHHGAATSASGAFLQALQAEVAIISVGRNGYGHPSPYTMSRLEQQCSTVFRTDRNGAVVLRYRPGARGFTVHDMISTWKRVPMFRELRSAPTS